MERGAASSVPASTDTSRRNAYGACIRTRRWNDPVRTSFVIADAFHHVMPGLVPGTHDLLRCSKQDIDGRDKPGHDKSALPEAWYRSAPLAAQTHDHVDPRDLVAFRRNRCLAHHDVGIRD